ncbi:hypothetical protein ACFQY0_15550 [Haloferula chungangensis]|uniref:Addiction module antitoxin RelB n=1 Tax=Haloferula chungangensis TaxID=1048331 RepID=A0ABW2LBP9_9BACT
MSEEATALLEKAIGLAPDERERLAHTLMEYVEGERESLRLAEDRLEEVESGRAKMIPAREVMSRLRADRD